MLICFAEDIQPDRPLEVIIITSKYYSVPVDLTL